MHKCVRYSDNAVFECVQWTGSNTPEVRGLFQPTNTPYSEVIVCTTSGRNLELKVYGESGYYRSFYAAPNSYIVNEYGKPIIYEDDESFSHRFFWAGNSGAPHSVEGSESKTKGLWDDFNNLLDIKGALTSVVITADVFAVTKDFDAEAFRGFMGSTMFEVCRRYSSAGLSFEYVTIPVGSMLGKKIKPGDSVVRLSTGDFLHAPYTHSF